MTFRCVKFTGTEKHVFRRTKQTWVKLFRGYHSHFTSNSRPYTEYGCSVNVQALRVFTPKWRKMQASSTLIIVLICLCILETLTCTLLPDNQDWRVTHVGRFRNCSVHLEAGWERVLWFPFDPCGCGKWTYQGKPRAITVPPLRWGLLVLLGHFQVHAIVRVGRAADSGHASLQTRQW